MEEDIFTGPFVDKTNSEEICGKVPFKIYQIQIFVEKM
jgi:hypothetical protein